MTVSETYKTTDIANINKNVLTAANTPNLQSATFYKGEKGDEVADYSYNYKLGDSSIIKSTSVFFYAKSGTQTEDQRASSADPLSAMNN